MKKNQKYTREQMYQAIELCKQEGLSHMQYSKQSGINYQTFKFWVKKYNRENGISERSVPPVFMPVQVVRSDSVDQARSDTEYLTITYPNGIQVNCPVSMLSTILITLPNT